MVGLEWLEISMKKIDIKRLKIRDEVTRTEHFNSGAGTHRSLKDKHKDRNSKQSKKLKNELRRYL